MKNFKIGDLVIVNRSDSLLWVGKITEYDVGDKNWPYGVTLLHPRRDCHESGRGWGYYENELTSASHNDLELIKITHALMGGKL